MTYERVNAGDIRPGDRVARARTHEFRTVSEIQPGATAVRLIYTAGGNDRPRKSAQWWREVDSPTESELERLYADSDTAERAQWQGKVSRLELELSETQAELRDAHQEITELREEIRALRGKR